MRCNVESFEMIDFSHLRELQFLSLTFGHSLCSGVKLLSKVLNDNCIVRFYHELDPDCYIKVRQGKVIIKNVGKYFRIHKDELSSGSISK